MRYTLLVLIFKTALLFPVAAYTCMCMDFRTLEQNIHTYPFIAYVKIVEKKTNDDTIVKGDEKNIRFSHKTELVLGIKELFKGDLLNSIKEYDVHTSCEIGIYAGEEWIIFASYDTATKTFYIGGCNPSKRLRNRKGEQNWTGGFTAGTLRSLREFFKHPLPEYAYDNGQFTGYYENGNIEWQAEYNNGKLHGNQKIYFADGKINIDENYVEGEPGGYYTRYNNTGQLIEERLYEKGKRIRSKEWYDYTVNHNEHFIKTPEYKGKSAMAWIRKEFFWRDSSYSYDRNYYKSGTLEKEAVYDYTGDSCVITNYFESGDVNYRTTRLWKEKKYIYQQWDKEGKLEIDHVYVNDIMVEDRKIVR